MRHKRLPGEAVHDIVLGSQHVEAFTRLLPLRLAFDRSLLLVGNGQYGQSRVLFKPGERDAGVDADDQLVVQLPPATAPVLAATLRLHAGNHAVAGLPITFAVGQSVIAA